MQEVMVSSKGQIVVPKAVRKELGIKSGTRLIVGKAGISIMLTPRPKNPAKALSEFGKRHMLDISHKEIKDARRDRSL